MNNNKLFIGNLAFNLNESDLQVAFEQFGEIDEIRLIVDRTTQKSKGFAFITFFDSSSAKSALDMDGQQLEGRSLRVNFAIQKKSNNSK